MSDGIKFKDANGDTYFLHADAVDYDGLTGAKVERVKLGYGIPGAFVDISDTDPMPVELAGAALAALATAAKQDEVKASVDLLHTDLTGTVKTRQSGTYAYVAGVAAVTVDVPGSARLTRVSVLAGAAVATVTIGGGSTITIPAGGSFDEQIPGEALGADVVIAGSISSYYVAWVN